MLVTQIMYAISSCSRAGALCDQLASSLRSRAGIICDELAYLHAFNTKSTEIGPVLVRKQKKSIERREETDLGP